MESESERMVCPYNKNHSVDPLRMPYHLMKCRKKFPDVRFAVCPYSALHEVPQVELQHHMANCPDKRLVEGVDPPHALLYSLTGREPNMLKGCTDIPPPAKVQFEDDDEQWDVNIDRNQGPLSLSPSSQVTHGRCHVRRNDETDNLRHSRNTLPVDFQVRRPITHSVAERLRPKLSSDSPEDVSTSESSDFCENSDSGSDSVAGIRLFGQEDKSSTKNSDTSTTSDVTVSANLSSRLSGGMNIESDKIEENKVLATAKDKYIMRGRGRASLLDILPNRTRSERKPGPVLSLSSFPVVGRGRSLSKIPATDS